MNIETKLTQQLEANNQYIQRANGWIYELKSRQRRLKEDLALVEKQLTTLNQKVAESKMIVTGIEKSFDLVADRSKFRFGYEKVGNKYYKIFNHNYPIGYYKKTSASYFRGYSLDKEFVIASRQLETVCLGLFLAQERKQCQQ